MDIEHSILLIEKDEKSADLIREWLKFSESVTHVTKTIDAKNLKHPKKWNVAIIDIEFIKEDEIDIIAWLKSLNSRTQVLILLTQKNLQPLATAIKMHIDGLLFKPLEKSTFLDLVVQLNKSSVVERRKRDQKIVLAIGAHPDDVEIGCGGTLIHHVEKMDPVYILTISGGEVGGDIKIRQQESKRAAEKLGATLFLHNLTDTQISDGAETIQLIENIIGKIKPTHVYTHSEHDSHQDHRNVYAATMVACRAIPNVYCYQSPSSTMEFKPSLFIDISEYLNAKIKLISFYKSQSESRLYLKEDMIFATARYWGRYANYNLVEPLEIIRNR